ncbi:hypothetical protein AAIG99_33195, partial [Pseudomonas aeruginosa]
GGAQKSSAMRKLGLDSNAGLFICGGAQQYRGWGSRDGEPIAEWLVEG